MFSKKQNNDGACQDQNDYKNQLLQLASSGGTPGNNQAQNAQIRNIAREFGLNKDQRRELHDEISGQNYGYQEIRAIAIEMFGTGR